MVAEEMAIKQREIDEWNKKIVVGNKHFFVNTKPNESHQLDKYQSLREDKVNKIGLRLGKQKLQQLTDRQIKAAKGAPNMPIAALANEQWIMNDTAHKAQKPLQPDYTMIPGGTNDSKVGVNFNRYNKHGVEARRPSSKKVFIQPLTENEKLGLKWSKTPQAQHA